MNFIVLPAHQLLTILIRQKVWIFESYCCCSWSLMLMFSAILELYLH